jgi:hypothetical protein
MSRNGRNSVLPRIGGGLKKTEKKRCGVLIGIPTRGQCRIEWATTLRLLNDPLSLTWGIRTCTNEQIDTARNSLVYEAREQGADYLFFLDDDTLIQPASLFKLTYDMEQFPEADVVTAICPTRSNPPAPTIFKDTEGYHKGPYWDWTFGEVFEITACGFPATLVRMSAFEKVDPPWFLNTRGRVNGKEGEDTYFCRKLREAGGRIFADGGLLCGHIGEDGTVYQLLGTEKPFKNAAEKKGLSLEKFMKTLTPAGSVEAK